jgi:Derlin-2/3
MEQAEPQQGVQNNNNAGAGGGGVPIEQWYFELPIITRIYATGAVLTTLLCQLNVISPFHLYFSFRQIVYNKQYWRLFTNFFFFGSFGLDFIFYIFFLVRYCRMLEEGSFRGRSADFAWMLILGALFLTGAAPFVHLLFLGSSLTFMMVYVWARRNPDVRMNFLGNLSFLVF